MMNWIDKNQHRRPFGLSSPNGCIEVSAEACAPVSPIVLSSVAYRRVRCATQSERCVWMLNGIDESQPPALTD